MNDNDQKNKGEVVRVLQQFQDGYTKRDTLVIDAFLDMCEKIDSLGLEALV
jgi:hypothetical protein